MYPTNEGAVPSLEDVVNLSDRGYTIEETIFGYLIPSGAGFLHTAKRVSPFPFIWGKRPRRNDKRDYLGENGYPALFIKELFSQGRLVSLFAFRTGTSNISAIVTNKLHDHEWEGICLKNDQRLLWETFISLVWQGSLHWLVVFFIAT